MSELSVLSYNIHHGTDPRGEPSLDRIADTIAAAAPDVVCLQEVDRHWGKRSGHADQVAELSDRLGMDAHFVAALRKPNGGYGNAVLARAPITRRDEIRLSTPDGVESRAAAVTDIDTPVGPVTVGSAHLTVGARHGAVRRDQLATLARLCASAERPVILAADFNTHARDELAVLTAAARHARAPWWSPSRLGVLTGRRAGATHPAGWPTRPIDRVYLTGGLRATKVKVLRGNGSDHRPILVTVRAA